MDADTRLRTLGTLAMVVIMVVMTTIMILRRVFYDWGAVAVYAVTVDTFSSLFSINDSSLPQAGRSCCRCSLW